MTRRRYDPLEESRRRVELLELMERAQAVDVEAETVLRARSRVASTRWSTIVRSNTRALRELGSRESVREMIRTQRPRFVSWVLGEVRDFHAEAQQLVEELEASRG